MKAVFVIVIVVCISSVGTVTDEVNLEKAMDHVHELVEYSPRLAGSETADDNIIGGGYSAALYLYETLKSYGYDVEIEEFPITTFQITEVAVIVDFDGDFSTPDQMDLTDKVIPPTVRHGDVFYDVTAPLVFLEDSTDIEGKVPVFDYWLYYNPDYTDIVGHSALSFVYKEGEPAFAARFRETFSLSYKDYLVMKQKRTPDTYIRVKFSSHTKEVEGYNVVGYRQGGTRKVILAAHYDSVYTDGAIDNGSGVAALLETARILSGKRIDATVYFVFFDAEEIGLLGSEAFVAAHELSQSVCINVDSIASGDTVYVGGTPRYEEMWPPYYCTDAGLDLYVGSIAEEILGYTPERWYLEDAGGYSDFVTFAREGIPSTDITTMDKEAAKIPAVSAEKLSENAFTWLRGGKVVYYQEDRLAKVIPHIHTSFDDVDHFDEELFYDATLVVAEAAYKLSTTAEGEVEPAHIALVGVCAVVVILWCMIKKR